LGKAGNKQLSYILGNKSDLHAEELVGQGDLKLNAVGGTNRFAGIFTTRQELEALPKAPFINRLPLDDPWKSQNPRERPGAGGEGPLGPPPAPPSPSLAKAIAQTKPISPELLCESLISLQRQMDDPTYRQDMRGRAYFILPPRRVKELGRNPEMYKTYDQPYLVEVFKALRRRGVQLCLSSKSS
jgi:hypothetical protein